MTERTFKTSEILAAIHGFPTIIAAREKQSIIDAFDHLRNISPEIAGIEFPGDHLSWCVLSRATVPVLREHFSALAAEKFPDADYWSNPDSINPEKMTAMAEWVGQIERKYGVEIKVPDIRNAVLQQLELRS